MDPADTRLAAGGDTPDRPTTASGNAPGALAAAPPAAAITAVWLVVNGVNVLQAIGFATRPAAPWLNPLLGLVIAALAGPATWALRAFLRAGAGWRFVAGPVVFDAFIVLMLVVDHLLHVPWRDPVEPAIQVPYLVLFFGSIFLMGAPMFRIDRRRWLVTAATTVLLLGAMGYALSTGVG